MSRAIALLAGLGAGYLAGDKQNKEDERRAKEDARQQAKFDADMADRAQVTADKDALRAAAAPVSATPGDEFKPSMDTPVPTGDFKVGAARYASQGVADKAAADYNAPAGYRARASALAAGGNQFAAQAVTNSMQTDAAQGQLDEQHQLQQAREFARGVSGSLAQGGWKGFAKFATEKYNDDNKYEAVEDGKGGAIMIATGKDGKEIGRTSFATPEDAIMFSVGRADPSKWADYKAKRDDAKADAAYKDGTLKVAQQNANTSSAAQRSAAAHQGTMEGFERERIAIAKEVKANEDKIDPADKVRLAGIDAEAKQINAEVVKAKAMAADAGGWNPAANPGQEDLRKRVMFLAAQRDEVLAKYSKGAGVDDLVASVRSGGATKPGEKPLTGTTIADIQTQLRGGAAPRPAAMAAQGIAPAATGPLATLPLAQLQAIASSPRNQGWQEAQQELKRRTSADPRMADPATNPALYAQ